MFYVRNLHTDHYLYVDGWHDKPIACLNLEELQRVIGVAINCFPLVEYVITTNHT